MKKDRRNKREFVHIGDIIDKAIKNYRIESDEELSHVWSLWNGLVGEAIAKNAQPAAFKGKLLLVHVTSSTWMHQLQFMKEEIKAKVNNALGKNLIEEIKFKIGSVE
jgi:predicted nucleic acid-binding Zn ribbon protein